VMMEPLSERRALLKKHVLPKLREPIYYPPELKAVPSPTDCFGQISRAGRAGRETPQQPL